MDGNTTNLNLAFLRGYFELVGSSYGSIGSGVVATFRCSVGDHIHSVVDAWGPRYQPLS